MTQRTPARVAFRRPWPGTRRGRCLWALGLAVMLVGGVNYITTELPERTQRSLYAPLALTGGSGIPWGIVMVAVGGVAVFSAYCHFGRDRYGYYAISMLCLGWGGCYIAGSLNDGGLRALGGAVIWLLFGYISVVVSGFPNERIGAAPTVEDCRA